MIWRLDFVWSKRFREAFGLISFFTAIILLTRFDFFVNGILNRFGLVYSDGWFWNYQVIYFLVWQFTLLSIYAYQRHWFAFLFYEGFVLSGGIDLVYFALWNNLKFPVGDWWWIWFSRVLGVWTTDLQIAFSTAVLTGVACFYIIKRP